MQWEFPHRVQYEASASSVDDVVASLLAQERLLEEGAGIIAGIAGLEISDVRVRVTGVAAGTLVTEFIVGVYGAYQSDIQDSVVAGVERMFGVDVPEGLEPLVTLGALAVTYFVARFAYDAIRGKNKDRPASTHIEGDYNKVVNIIASKLEVDPSFVERAVEGKLIPAKRRSLIRPVTDFLNLARRDKGTGIKVDGYGDIAPETIAEYPNDAELSEIDEAKNLDLPNVELEIRATDKDRSKTGWAAGIIGDKRFKRRLPMDLYPTVNSEHLAKQDRVWADVVLEGETLADGEFKPKRIHLLNYRGGPGDEFEGSSGQETS